MAQKNTETAYTLQNPLGTRQTPPLPKAAPVKKSSTLKRTLAYAAVGATVVGGTVIGANALMDNNAPKTQEKAQEAANKTVGFNPLTLQQQVDAIARFLQKDNATPTEIQQAQLAFIHNIEESGMLKRIPNNTKLSIELDNHILKTLKNNLKNPKLTTNEAIVLSMRQTGEALKGGRQAARMHKNQLQFPELNNAYVNMHNTWPDSKNNEILETDLLRGALNARYRAVGAFLNGQDNAKAIALLDTFRSVALAPDLEQAVKESLYERAPAAKRAMENVSKQMRTNISDGQEPFMALCAAAQRVTGIDENELATPPAYIVPAFASAQAEHTNQPNWTASLKAPENNHPIPWQVKLFGGIAVVGVAGFAFCGYKIHQGDKDISRGWAKQKFQEDRKNKAAKDKKESQAVVEKMKQYQKGNGL